MEFSQRDCHAPTGRGWRSVNGENAINPNNAYVLTRAGSAVFQASLLWGTFYLNLKGLIKIDNRAMLETLPLEHGLQFFVTFWNEGTNRANIFGLAMIQDRLN